MKSNEGDTFTSKNEFQEERTSIVQNLFALARSFLQLVERSQIVISRLVPLRLAAGADDLGQCLHAERVSGIRVERKDRPISAEVYFVRREVAEYATISMHERVDSTECWPWPYKASVALPAGPVVLCP